MKGEASASPFCVILLPLVPKLTVILSGADRGFCDLRSRRTRGCFCICFCFSFLPQACFATVGSTTHHPSLRSLHVGFIFSISAIFFARIHPFSCFSRAIALFGPVKRSNQTSRLQLYCAENPGWVLCLCSKMRLSRLPVTPM